MKNGQKEIVTCKSAELSFPSVSGMAVCGTKLRQTTEQTEYRLARNWMDVDCPECLRQKPLFRNQQYGV